MVLQGMIDIAPLGGDIHFRLFVLSRVSLNDFHRAIYSATEGAMVYDDAAGGFDHKGIRSHWIMAWNVWVFPWRNRCRTPEPQITEHDIIGPVDCFAYCGLRAAYTEGRIGQRNAL